MHTKESVKRHLDELVRLGVLSQQRAKKALSKFTDEDRNFCGSEVELVDMLIDLVGGR